MNLTRSIIEDFGGITRVASELGIKGPSVSEWITNNKIPPLSAARLYLWSVRHDLQPDFEDLFYYIDDPLVKKHLKNSPYKTLAKEALCAAS